MGVCSHPELDLRRKSGAWVGQWVAGEARPTTAPSGLETLDQSIGTAGPQVGPCVLLSGLAAAIVIICCTALPLNAPPFCVRSRTTATCGAFWVFACRHSTCLR